MDKTQVLDMYSMILPAGNAAVFVDQIFRIFDKDGNGSIDFKVCIRSLLGSDPYKIHKGASRYDVRIDGREGEGRGKVGLVREVV